MALRNARLYGLYRVVTLPNGRKRYTRETGLAFPKAVAVRVFQNALLAGAFSGQIRELRPINRGMFCQGGKTC